jgi:imidazolonepropionase-like amidohydrolase
MVAPPRTFRLGGTAALGALMLAAGLGGAAAQAKAPTPLAISQGLVLDGVTVVDTHTGRLTPNRTVVVEGGRITRIARAGAVKAMGSARRIDARGKYVVPGYLDLHVHPLDSTDPEGGLTLLLANGVTGIRQMSGSPDILQKRREGRLMPAVSPELLALPGTILTRANAGSPEAAVAEIDRQKDQGADFIKLIDTSPPTFFAAVAEAKRLGPPILGHLPTGVDVAEAARAGMTAVEHLGPTANLLLSCSTDEAQLRQAIAQAPARATPPPSAAPTAAQINATQIAAGNPVLLTDAAGFALIQRVIDTYSDAKCRKLAALFVQAGMWQSPTLIRLHTMEFGDDPRHMNDPDLRYVPTAKRQGWQALGQQFQARITPVQHETFRQLFALQQKVVKLFDETGVRMTAGSDSGGGAGWDIPGFAIHHEFDLLAQAGLSPLRILQMATLDGAQFLHRQATLGAVAVGKDADLVLLDANPIASAANLHRIDAVVRGGIYYSRQALDEMKDGVAKRIAEARP